MEIRITAFVALVATSITACGQNLNEPAAEVEVSKSPPSVTFKPENDQVSAGKPSGPITVSYRIIGKPVVGEPVAIDLRVTSTYTSAMGPQPVSLSYRAHDTTAIQLGKSQPASVMLAPGKASRASAQQVTIIPMREGRLYFNVTASVETENGSMSTVTAIPIQVGDAPRILQENGTLETDADGNAIRVLPADES